MSTEQKKDLNQYYLDTYTKEASVYDQRRWTSKGGSKAKSLRNAYFFDILRKYNLIQPEKKIIDVASGTGRVALELVTFGYKKVVACDLTNAMLDVSRSKLPAQYKDILEYHVADMKKVAVFGRIIRRRYTGCISLPDPARRISGVYQGHPSRSTKGRHPGLRSDESIALLQSVQSGHEILAPPCPR